MPYAFLLAHQAPPKKVSYGQDVEPILKAHCTSCHGGPNADAGLDLTSPKGIFRGGDSGPAVIAGKPDTSLLLQRVLGLGKGPRMPKRQAPLSADEIATLTQWIANGAKTDDAVTRHWAYIAPVKPAIPALKSTWIKNPIDAFVLDRMTGLGLHPSVEASKETLIRRVSLDLTGLPPKLSDIDAFLADKRPDAYEHLVDRLLASPQYGERQARGWLDLARYADTDGFEKDLNRTAWKYRDWVIDAFNHNLSYKDFVIQQIAGDMLPHATLDQKIATGFHRNTMFNREGGVDQEEAHFGVILDRVDVTATVFLGSTLQCARCHDHKYDPFTQHDYYKMAAFYSNSKILPRGPQSVSEEKWFEPEIPAPSPAQRSEMARIQSEISVLDVQYHQWDAKTDQQYSVWKLVAAKPVAFRIAPPQASTATSGAKLTCQPDGSILASGPVPDNDTYRLTLPASATEVTALKIEALTDPSLPSNGPGRAGNGNFVLTGVKVECAGKLIPLASAQADFNQTEFDASRVVASDPKSGWAVSGQLGKPHELLITLTTPVPAGAPFSLELQHLSPYGTHVLGKFRVSTTDVNGSTILIPQADRLLAAKASLTVPEQAQLKEAYLESIPELKLAGAKLAALKKAQTELQAQIPTAMVMEELPTKEPPFAYVRSRGEFLTKLDKVVAATPAVLPPLPPGRPDRLALARWLVSPTNPLTARVEVNRIWEQYFGRGIVETCEDFGTKGSRPTHPALLDWLAVEFMQKGWDMKALHRLIVTSSTYRQTSSATPTLEAKDPQNLYLARGPRFRMEAEMIHDSALATSGLLSLKLGGPSVMPYQPDRIWDSPYSGEEWMPSKGQDAYRRGIYTFLKRTAPYPSFLTLDSTSRESCTVRRIRTNTPLQALALLNDKLMLEAAKALGERMRHSAKDDTQRITMGFRMCTARRPQQQEALRLKNLLVKLESRYHKNLKAASNLGGTPEQAAYTMVGNVLLNLDETITKG